MSVVVFHGSGIVVSILARAGWCVCVCVCVGGGAGTGRDGINGR